MTKTKPPKSSAFARKSLRQALRAWDRSEELGQHPLADLQIVETRRMEVAHQPSSTGYGLALREVLRAAITHLRPKNGAEDPYAKNWRPYLILSQEYIDGRSPDYLADQLGVARSTYNHSQAEALDKLSGILMEWEQGGAFPGKRRLPEFVSPEDSRPAFNAPRMVPYALVGRITLIDELRQALIAGKDVALSGLPGVGKSVLATALAHDEELRRHFQAGILWAGLGQNANILSELSKWAIALGLPVDMFTGMEGVRERASALHALLGERRYLLIIDDVWESQHGLALKVGGSNCAHLYTTRSPSVANQLAGGNTREIAELVEGEGVSLLRRFVPDIDAATAHRLVKAVDGLPLGLVIMGKYLQGELRSGQDRRVEEAFRRLDDPSEVLQIDQLQSPLDQQPSLQPDTPLSLNRVLELSIDTLDPHAKDLLAGLSLFPPKPNTFSEQTALQVTGASTQSLDALADHGLLEPSGGDRYTLHRIITLYAHANLAAEQTHKRFIDYFLEFIEDHARDHLTLERESRNIIAALDLAHENGLQEELIRGANAYFPHLEVVGLLEQAGDYLGYAEEAARSGKDRLSTMANLGKLAHRRAEYEQAQAYYAQGLELAQEQEDLDAQCAMLRGLGVVAFSRGQYEAAEEYYQRGLDVVRENKKLSQHAIGLNANMGSLVLTRDDANRAKSYFQKALDLARKAEDNAKISATLTNLGILAARQGEHDKAGDYFKESLALARAAGNEKNVGYLSLNLGTLASEQGRDRKAQDYFRDALAVAKKMGDRAQVAQLQGNLGALATQQGDFYRARVLLESGLRLARQIGQREHTIHLLINLGSLHQEQGTHVEARSTFEEALSLAEEVDHQRFIKIIENKLDELSNLE